MEHLINKEGVNRFAEKEAGGRNALNLQMTLNALEPLKRLAEKFDVAPYDLSYPDTLRINGTGDNASLADVVRHHCFITLGDCRRAKYVFNKLERQDARAASAGVGQCPPAQLPDSSDSSGGGSDGGAEFGEPGGERANTVPGPMELLEMTLALRAADKMAWVCDDWVQRHRIDSRSALADARLDYGHPYRYRWSKLEAPSDPNGLKSADASSSQNQGDSLEKEAHLANTRVLQMALEACEFVTRLFSQPSDPSRVEIKAAYEQCRAALVLANEKGISNEHSA